MDVQTIISSFVRLGDKLERGLNSGEYDHHLVRAFAENGWFTKENTELAIRNIINQFLNEDKLKQWVSDYSELTQKSNSHKSVAIIMAGNIPLAGWHDLMCTLVAGHKCMLKLSSKDRELPGMLLEELYHIEPKFSERIQIVEKLQEFDAVIATGSNNTSRYFEYYFGKYPHIIRKNRVSVAVLKGDESNENITELGKDIFNYFGLGCRNVSSINIPKGYEIGKFFEPLESYKSIIEHKKYRNNYDYYKSIMLLNKEKHFDNGFLLLKESNSIYSQVATLNYSYYEDIAEVTESLRINSDNLQCIVSKSDEIPESVQFGKTQVPELWYYADNVDTVKWLTSI